MNGDGFCAFIKPSGQRCQARPLTNETVCFFHSSNKAQARRQAQQSGGRNRRAVLPPETPRMEFNTIRDVVAALADAYNQVRRGELDHRVGHCLAVLAGQLFKALQASELERLAAEIEKLKVVAAKKTANGRNGVGMWAGPAKVGQSDEHKAVGFSDVGSASDCSGDFSDEALGGTVSDHSTDSEDKALFVDGDGRPPLFPDTAASCEGLSRGGR